MFSDSSSLGESDRDRSSQ